MVKRTLILQVDDILGDILSLEQVDASTDQDLNMLLLSSTAPHDNSSTHISADPAAPGKQTSASAPNELIAWCKDRQRKDNHNQSE